MQIAALGISTDTLVASNSLAEVQYTSALLTQEKVSLSQVDRGLPLGTTIMCQRECPREHEGTLCS